MVYITGSSSGEQLNPFMKGPSTSLLAKGSELLWWSCRKYG